MKPSDYRAVKITPAVGRTVIFICEAKGFDVLLEAAKSVGTVEEVPVTPEMLLEFDVETTGLGGLPNIITSIL